AELERVRGETEAGSEREAQLETLMADVSGTAASLRAAFDEVQGRLEAQVATEREQYGRELAAIEGRVNELHEQLTGASEEFRSRLEIETAARSVAEAELAA